MNAFHFFKTSILFFILLPVLSFATTTTTADHTVLVSNYSFTPSELTIAPGETVAFINVEGVHNINGVNSTLTGNSFNNPFEFFLSETEGTAAGVLMGEITFDQPGTYQYDCSIGFHAQLGMVGNIKVDAFTIRDLLASDTIPDIWLSKFAFNTYLDSLINGVDPITVFIPNNAAVSEVMELMNLNQFDLLGFQDLGSILEYHVASGVWLEGDLVAGMSLPTIHGQNLTISEAGGALQVDGATILATNYLADNGVVHVIDECLAPLGLPQATVWDVIKNSPDHELLETAIVNADLVEELKAQNDLDPSLDLPGPFTVFAPTDAAFEAYSLASGMTTDELLTGQFVDEIVKMHIIGSKQESTDFFNGQQLINYLGQLNQMSISGNEIFVEGIPLQATDLQAYNGVVHVIDSIIVPELPAIEGTCGTWTLLLQGADNDGWEGNFIEVEIDEAVISTETISNGNSSVFRFGVDAGSKVNLFYSNDSSNGSDQAFKLFNENNELIFNSGGIVGGTFPSSAYGLRACSEPSSCGMIEIEMFDAYGDGWDAGRLEVYINDEFFNTIPMPYGYSQKAYIPTSEGDTLDFNYIGGIFPEENSFIVYDPDGSELVNQFNENQTPQDVSEIIVCENITSTSIDEQSVDFNISIFPNPTSDKLNITSDIEILRLGVINTYGQKVNNALYENEQLDVSYLKSGTYILEVKTVKGSEFHKFSIIR